MHVSPANRGSPVPRVLSIIAAFLLRVVLGPAVVFAIAAALGVSFIGAIIVATGVLAIGGMSIVTNRRQRRVGIASANGARGIYGNLVNIDTSTRSPRLLTRMTTGVVNFLLSFAYMLIAFIESRATRVNIFMLRLAGTFAFSSNTMLATPNGMMMSTGTSRGTGTTSPPLCIDSSGQIGNRGETTTPGAIVPTPVPRTAISPSCGAS